MGARRLEISPSTQTSRNWSSSDSRMSRVTSDTDRRSGSERLCPVIRCRADENRRAKRSIHHRIRSTDTAFPSVASRSTSSAQKTVGPEATSNRRGMPVRNFSIASSFLIPMTEWSGPVMPISVMYAVPFGRICSSAVWTWVCVRPRQSPIRPDNGPWPFFRRRFGMHVDHNGGDLRLQSLHFALRNLKGQSMAGMNARPIR